MRDALLSHKLEEHKVCPPGFPLDQDRDPMGSSSFISLVHLVSSLVLKLGHVCLDVNAANTFSK